MKKWYKYIKPYLSYFILGPLCMIVEVIGEVVMPMLLAVVINQGAKGTLTVNSSLGVMALMIATAILMMLGGVGGAYFGAKASVNFAADLRKDAFKKVQQYSFANIDKFSTGSLVTRLTNDVTQMQNFVNMMLRMALRSPGMLIAALVMAVNMKPELSVVFVAIIPVMLIVIGLIIRISFPRFANVQKKVDALNSTVQENVTNVRVVKSFVREDFEEEKFRKANRDWRNATYEAVSIIIFMGPAITFFMQLATVAVLWFGGNMVIDGNMNIGDLSAFTAYVGQILFSLMMITMLLMNSSRALASARRIREVLDEELDLTDADAKHPDKKVTDGEIRFKNVSFKYYKKSSEYVLEDINLTIKPHSTVGIIGSTGCGKTTLISLISRLYDVDKGEVLVDGVNVKDYSLHNLREGVGVVLQKNALFSGTIAENLRWGDEDATDDEMRSAAKNAQADKFIDTFTDGYDTMLEQGGTNVSGGQKQRLCIARALLKNPKVIILDDSTSAVDTATESQIRNTFANQLKDSTKIIIAQRITSVMDADTIVVMNDGKITGIGTHDQLLETNEEYQEIYYSQTDKKGA